MASLNGLLMGELAEYVAVSAMQKQRKIWLTGVSSEIAGTTDNCFKLAKNVNVLSVG